MSKNDIRQYSAISMHCGCDIFNSIIRNFII